MEPNFSRFRLVLKQSASYLFIYPGCVCVCGGGYKILIYVSGFFQFNIPIV
jgi:hypothetical protein